MFGPMFRKLLGFEIKLHTRQIGFWVTVLIMFLIGILIMSSDGVTLAAGAGDGERVKTNGAGSVALQISALSLASIFFGAIFVVSGVMRDQVHKSLEVVHATPVSTRDMMLSRMIGVYIATFLCLFGLVIGLFAGQFMPWTDSESLGPINVFYFLQPSIVFIAINTLLISGFFTMVAATTRNRALVYVSAVGLFIVYIMSGLLVGEDASPLLTSLSDPFGASAFAVVAEFWPAAEQNVRMAPIWGYVGLNRLVWGAVGLVLYFAVFRLFKRGMVSGKVKTKLVDDEVSTGRIILHPAATQTGLMSKLNAMWTRFKFEYLTTVKSVPFVILGILAVALFAMVIYVTGFVEESPPLPTSFSMANSVLGSLLIPLLIIIVFFSGEIIWRDKTSGMTEILDASPVKNWPLMGGKWLALFAVIATLVGLSILTGMIAQVIIGDMPIILSTYLKLAFIGYMPRFILYAILVLFIQNFMPNRVTGMLAAGALVIFFFFFIGNFPFSHPLMSYGRMSTGALSEFNGFSSLINFKWFGLYWGALATFFAVVSILLWRRGMQASLMARFKSIGARLSLPLAGVGVLALVGFVGTGLHIYKAYNVDGNFRTQKQGELRQVKWEETFGDMYKARLPKIRKVDVSVTFNQSEQTAEVSGEYFIENTTGVPLKEVYINMVSSRRKNAGKLADELNLVGASHVSKGDKIDGIEDFGYRLYRFDTPLAIGASTTMNFKSFITPPRLGVNGQIERNGTFVNNRDIMPQIGISDGRMTNPDKRRKYGLDEYEKLPSRGNDLARSVHFIDGASDYVDFSAKMCTDIGQIAIAPGEKIREYEENGKACRDYKTVRPILNFMSFLSADFKIKRDVWNNPNGADVPLAIYYHSAHDYNVDLMIDAMKVSLDSFTTTFGPYLYNQMRIMEFPYGSFAQSFAGTIPFSESIGFVMDSGDPDNVEDVDFATYVTMHEIGHQWFAHQIVPAPTKGFNVLSEGLTENTALLAYENKYGWQKTRRVLERRSIRSYLTGRTIDRKEEPPLAKAEGQQYLDYNKSSWVFWGLKHYMGYDEMQAAIRGFLEEYGSKGPPYPTTAQLVDALRAAAPDHLQTLITDYFDRIAFWELKFDGDIAVTPNTEGGYKVILTADVNKNIAAEEDGKETSITEMDGEGLDEWIEIGFYDKDPKDTLGDEWLKLERIHITQLKTELTFNLDERPTHILLDPRRLLMERNYDDNVKKLPKKLAGLDK